MTFLDRLLKSTLVYIKYKQKIQPPPRTTRNFQTYFTHIKHVVIALLKISKQFMTSGKSTMLVLIYSVS